MIKSFFKLSVLLVAILTPVSILWSAIFPWESAEKLLSEIGFENPISVSGVEKWGTPNSYRKESYVSVPAFLANPEIVTVYQENNERIEVQRSVLGFFETIVFVSYFFLLYGLVIYLWVWPIVHRKK